MHKSNTIKKVFAASSLQKVLPIVLLIAGCEGSYDLINSKPSVEGDKTITIDFKNFPEPSDGLLTANCNEGTFKVEGDPEYSDLTEMRTLMDHLAYLDSKESSQALGTIFILPVVNNACIQKLANH